MGNTMQQAGFGDTRISEGPEDDFDQGQNISESEHLPPPRDRTGWPSSPKYTRAESLQLERSNVPLTIQKKYLNSQVNVVELERIWDAYKALLVDSSIRNNNRDQGGLQRMISVKKLYKQGRMYMNMEEIMQIQKGQLKEYLLQFNDSGEETDGMIDLGNLNFDQIGTPQQQDVFFENVEASDDFQNGSDSPTNINEINEKDALFKYHSNEKSHENQFAFPIDKQINTTSKKKRYDPDTGVIGRDSNADGFKIDMEMRTSDCGFMGAYGGFQTDPCGGNLNIYNDEYNQQLNNSRGRNGLNFGIVMLDFVDFYDLMKLKIQYQRQSISQIQQNMENVRGIGTVEYAAVQAYGQRLSMVPQSQFQSESKDYYSKNNQMGFTSNRNKKLGISRRNLESSTYNKMQKSNVIVDAEQKNVSCFLWPSFSQMTPKQQDIYQITENTMRSGNNGQEFEQSRRNSNRYYSIYSDDERPQFNRPDATRERHSVPAKNKKFRLSYQDSPSPQVISQQIAKLDKENDSSQDYNFNNTANNKLEDIHEMTSNNEYDKSQNSTQRNEQKREFKDNGPHLQIVDHISQEEIEQLDASQMDPSVNSSPMQLQSSFQNQEDIKVIKSQNDISLNLQEVGLKPLAPPSENVSVIPPTGSGVNFNCINNNNEEMKDKSFLAMPKEGGKIGTFNTALEGSHVEVEDGDHISDADMHIEIASNVNV